jgi:signal transduction histidine kinase
MNDKRYRYILYTISLVIMATIAIQIYWNYKNYLTNKQQLVNDVQTSLDKAVDDYYADLAKKTTMGFSFEGPNRGNLFDERSAFIKILTDIDEKNKQFKSLDSVNANAIEGITVFRGLEADSMMKSSSTRKNKYIDSLSADIKSLKLDSTNIDLSHIEILTSKVFVSIKNDSLDVKAIDSLLKEDLLRKNISVDYNLAYKKNTHKHNSGIKVVSTYKDPDSLKHKSQWALSTFSKSTFLPENSKLEISFTNETKVVLQRILGGILISILLVLAVISCLFYLLKVIKHQKQLAEVKNDLISNITHEFKTPIATISVALESITSFNSIEDKEKTKKYIDMSSNQLSKLNVMVEKLLETATLDSDSLQLNKEETDIVSLLIALCNKYQIQNTEKTIQTSYKVEELITNVDVFHFENAINNILDNAIKYGGDLITIDLISKNENFEIVISDNGSGINKANKDRIFEKFYRVPKGNTHNVKGFGIGLYYTKTIIDKHNGTIVLDLNNALTTFKINMPNV